MKDFTQLDSHFFGSQTALEALAGKEKARLLVISDSHGSSSVLYAILQQYAGTIDGLCFCGDGAQDLVSLFEDALSGKNGLSPGLLPPVAALVRGNGDSSTAWFCRDDGSPSGPTVTQAFIPPELVLTAARKRILLTHGHRYDVYYSSQQLYEAAREQQADFVFFGHTHIANVQDKAGITLLNPGSCSRPRGGQPHTFALVTLTASQPGNDAIIYDYYQISGSGNQLQFVPYIPLTGEYNLLW